MSAHTIRWICQAGLDDGSPEVMRGVLHNIINELDNSREVTEKVTQGWTSAEGPHPTKGFKVTSHKARVVLDD